MTLSLKQIHARCDEVGECLLWAQSCTPNGYPRLSNGYAHKLAWETVNGPIPEAMMVGRRCGEKKCCNVAHMRLMTRRQQNQIAAKAGAWKNPKRIASITLKARARGKLTQGKVNEIRTSTEDGVTLAKRFGVSKSLISRVRLGQSWTETSRGASIFSAGAQK